MLYLVLVLTEAGINCESYIHHPSRLDDLASKDGGLSPDRRLEIATSLRQKVDEELNRHQA